MWPWNRLSQSKKVYQFILRYTRKIALRMAKGFCFFRFEYFKALLTLAEHSKWGKLFFAWHHDWARLAVTALFSKSVLFPITTNWKFKFMLCRVKPFKIENFIIFPNYKSCTQLYKSIRKENQFVTECNISILIIFGQF